jgi:hypothetical protein
LSTHGYANADGLANADQHADDDSHSDTDGDTNADGDRYGHAHRNTVGCVPAGDSALSDPVSVFAAWREAAKRAAKDFPSLGSIDIQCWRSP